MRTGATLLALAALAAPAPAQHPVINLQAYAIGVDVPESPAFVALGAAPPMRLGSAPKPLSFAATMSHDGAATVRAAAVDLTPYYLVGGGRRSLTGYRGNSVGARLMRVLTKTIVSFGAASASTDPGAANLAVAVRSTLHDPHDPVLNLRLPEQVAAAFAQAGVPLPPASDENVTDHGVELRSVFAAARRDLRARRGDPLVSAGWGLRVRAAGGSLDSTGVASHTIWLSAQYPFDERYDLVGTGDLRDAFDASRFVAGLALRRKGSAADYQLGVAYDARDNLWLPGVLVDARLATRLGAIAWVDAQTDPAATPVSQRLRAGLALRWFAAVDRAID